MTIEENCRLSFYQKLTQLNEKHGIWLVKHQETNKIFVMKELVIYNMQVYEVLKELKSCYFPRIHDCFVVNDGQLILIEEYISGNTIEQLITENGVMEENEAANIICEICKGLSLIHNSRCQIIHRDIKPSNVMINEDGRVKIIDFNAAKTHLEDKGQDTMLIGTKGYAAPEQYGFAQSDERTDIYALGVLLNFMLTGKQPKEQLAEGRLKFFIEKCTRLEPERRFQKVEEIMKALTLTGFVFRDTQSYNQCHETEMANGLYVSSTNPADNVGYSRKVRGWKRFLPPGFRSGTLLNMLIAMLGYAVLLYLCVTLEFVNKDGSKIVGSELYIMRFTIVLLCVFSVALFGDYMGIRDKFMYTTHKNQIVRWLALCVWWVIITFLLLVIMVLLSEIMKTIFGF